MGRHETCQVSLYEIFKLKTSMNACATLLRLCKKCHKGIDLMPASSESSELCDNGATKQQHTLFRLSAGLSCDAIIDVDHDSMRGMGSSLAEGCYACDHAADAD